MTTPTEIIPYGFCRCGCEQKTKMAPQTARTYGWIKGEPLLYVHGHNARGIKRSLETRAKLTLKIRHGHAREHSKSPTWRVWIGVIQRCSDQNCKSFKDYGGRGIMVCERWLRFENFLADMGERPAGLTIERMDSNGNYEPSNCKWATWTEQASNRRRSRYLMWNGKKYTLNQLSREVGKDRRLLSERLKRGWSLDRAISSPTGNNAGERQ